jgi:hypothetical protein
LKDTVRESLRKLFFNLPLHEGKEGEIGNIFDRVREFLSRSPEEKQIEAIRQVDLTDDNDDRVLVRNGDGLPVGGLKLLRRKAESGDAEAKKTYIRMKRKATAIAVGRTENKVSEQFDEDEEGPNYAAALIGAAITVACLLPLALPLSLLFFAGAGAAIAIAKEEFVVSRKSDRRMLDRTLRRADEVKKSLTSTGPFAYKVVFGKWAKVPVGTPGSREKLPPGIKLGDKV